MCLLQKEACDSGRKTPLLGCVAWQEAINPQKAEGKQPQKDLVPRSNPSHSSFLGTNGERRINMCEIIIQKASKGWLSLLTEVTEI